MRTLLARQVWLTRLLAAAMLLQSGAAMAHGLRAVAGAWVVELCSAEGKRHVLVDGQGREMPSPQEGGGFCPVCHGLAVVAAPVAPSVSDPVFYAAAPRWSPRGLAAPRAQARAPPYLGRAPPALA